MLILYDICVKQSCSKYSKHPFNASGVRVGFYCRACTAHLGWIHTLSTADRFIVWRVLHIHSSSEFDWFFSWPLSITLSSSANPVIVFDPCRGRRGQWRD